MIKSTSLRCIELLDLQRDTLFTAAVSCAAPDDAEALLQQSVRHAFKEMVEGKLSEQELTRHVMREMQSARPESNGEGGIAPRQIMPAAAWARLAAAVQIEAALLGGEVEQSMLAYDPLLAPKKKKSADDDQIEGFNLSPWTRFVIAAAIVLFIGIVASIVLTTRTDRKTGLSSIHSAPKSHGASAAGAARGPGSQP